MTAVTNGYISSDTVAFWGLVFIKTGTPWCESILGLKVETGQGKQFSLEWTETHGGLWEWWHDPGVPLVFSVESASS